MFSVTVKTRERQRRRILNCMILRQLLLLLFIIQSVGCTFNPYVLRNEKSGSVEDGRLFFMYGNFCGPGHPDLSRNDKILYVFFPPQDDIDAVCYAHDFCFQLIEKGKANGITCDDAFRATLSYLRFASAECSKLASDILLAFYVKFWEKGEESGDRFMGFWFSPGVIVGSLFLITGKAVGSGYIDYPSEGLCFAENVRGFEEIFCDI